MRAMGKNQEYSVGREEKEYRVVVWQPCADARNPHLVLGPPIVFVCVRA